MTSRHRRRQHHHPPPSSSFFLIIYVTRKFFFFPSGFSWLLRFSTFYSHDPPIFWGFFLLFYIVGLPLQMKPFCCVLERDREMMIMQSPHFVLGCGEDGYELIWMICVTGSMWHSSAPKLSDLISRRNFTAISRQVSYRDFQTFLSWWFYCFICFSLSLLTFWPRHNVSWMRTI